MNHFDQCARKRAYPSYAQAREVLNRMREQQPNDPTLHVYPCTKRDHYHIGHADGVKAERLIKRWEKRQRKEARERRPGMG